MKRIVALFLAALMLICSGAFAETLDVTAADFTADITKNIDIPLQLVDDAAYRSARADKVERDGETYIVRRGSNLTITLDMARFSTFLCFTQDLYASFDAYLRTSDPYTLLEELINNKIYFGLADTETEMMVFACEVEADSMSKMVDNFSTLSRAPFRQYAVYPSHFHSSALHPVYGDHRRHPKGPAWQGL